MSTAALSRLLCFDLDGTLAAIRSSPDSVKLSTGIRHLLRRLASVPGVQIAVVSGRSLRDVKRRVAMRGLVYAGNHGLEIRYKGRTWTHPAAEALRPAIHQVCRHLATRLSGIPGIVIEEKGLTASVHLRRVQTKDIRRVVRLVQSTMKSVPVAKRLILRSGKKVLEICPRLDWDKGRAVQRLLREHFRGAWVLYAGDDQTDETVFRRIGFPHMTIHVGRSTRTSALFALRRQGDMILFLRKLIVVLTEWARLEERFV